MSMSYEDWKAANIAAGGRGIRAVYDNWQAGMPESARSSDYQGTGAPREVVGQAGTGTAEQQRTGALASGSFQDDHADAGNASTGDPYLDELRSGRVAGAEDWRRFSNADLLAWKPYYIGGGKFQNQYGDIVGKPMDSGPNTPKNMDGMGKPRIGGDGGGGGGGGGQQQQPGQPAAQQGLYDPNNPLQNQLIQRAQQGGGYFGEMGDQQGAGPLSYALQGQGVWTSDPSQGADPLASAPASTAISQASQPGGSPALSNQPQGKQATVQGMGNTPQWSPLAQSGGTSAFGGGQVGTLPGITGGFAGPKQSPLMGGLMGGAGNRFKQK